MPENAPQSTPIAVGIDLGTSTSCACACVDGKPEILSNDQGERITPSVVSFGEDGTPLVGWQAKAHVVEDAKNTVYSGKRLIGRLYDSDEVRKARAVCAFEIVPGPSGDARVRMRGTDYSIPEISALVLHEMKTIAERGLGRPVEQAVITVPAYFNDNQRQATKDAGRIAGLEVLRIINEPTAAALAYGYGKEMAKKIAVYDLGGGTFDISILEIGKDIFEVLATAGDTYLGGDDLDDRLLDFLADGFVAEHGINVRRDRLALQKLRTACEKAKIELSTQDMTRIEIPDLYTDETGTKGISRTLTRADFIRLTQDLVDRTFKVCEEALQSAGLMAGDMDAVILVGGPTRLPMIRNAVQKYFGKEPQCHLDPEEVVATGAAIHAASLLETAKPTFLLDVTPLSLRLGITGGFSERIVEKNTPIPIEQTRTFTTVRDNQQAVAIRIYQGESKVAAENEMLGEFEFTGLRPAPRGEVKIEVTFEINTEGIVNVTARDQETGRRQATTVRLSSGLTEEEIRRASEDQAARARAAAPPPEAAEAETGTPSDLPAPDEMANLAPLGPGEELTLSPETQDLLMGIEPDPDDSKEGDGGA